VAFDDAVDQPVVAGLVGVQEAVALHVVMDLGDGLSAVAGVYLVNAPAQLEDLACVDLDVGRLALEAAARLVDQDSAVGEREALAGGAGGERSEPMLIAIPKQIVCTSGLMNCIVS
jgi:hypothetical protein